MKNLLRQRIPLTIKTEEDLRQLWAEFKEYQKSGKTGYASGNMNIRLTGAALFVDFLCGIKPKKRKPNTSYLRYPDTPWPLD